MYIYWNVIKHFYQSRFLLFVKKTIELNNTVSNALIAAEKDSLPEQQAPSRTQSTEPTEPNNSGYVHNK